MGPGWPPPRCGPSPVSLESDCAAFLSEIGTLMRPVRQTALARAASRNQKALRFL